MLEISSNNRLCLLENNFNSSLPLKPTVGPFVYKCQTMSVLTQQGSCSCDFNLAKINNNLIAELVIENHLIRRIIFVSDPILHDPSTSPADFSTYKNLSLMYDCWLEFRSPMALARNEEEKRISTALVAELRRQVHESQQKCREAERECKDSEQIWEQENRFLFDFHEKAIRLATTVRVRNVAVVFFFSSSLLTWLKDAFPSSGIPRCWYSFQALPYAKLCSKTRCTSDHKNYFYRFPKSLPAIQFTNNNCCYRRVAFPHQVSQFFSDLPVNPAIPARNFSHSRQEDFKEKFS